MRLVGASNGFIRGPFLMEGTLEALIAALLAIAALAAGSNALLGKLSDTLSFLSFDIAQSTVFATYGLAFGHRRRHRPVWLRHGNEALPQGLSRVSSS